MKHTIAFTSDSYPLVQEIGVMEDIEGRLKHPDRLLPELNVFVYVVDGQIQVNEENHSYTIRKGGYLYLQKNVHHWGEQFYHPGSKWYYIHFYTRPTELPVQEYSTLGKTSIIQKEEYNMKLTMPKLGTAGNPSYIMTRLQQLVDLFQSAHPMRPILSSMQAHQIFVELYQERAASIANQKTNRIVSKMIQLIDNTTDRKLTSQEISDALGMNYTYLSMLFKQQTGKNVIQYQNERIIEKAIELFQKENYNVSEVSEKLDFANPYYFSRVFKKVTGMSPSLYIKQIYRA
ncbi:AraC family transcriptional regulator [Gracilibacillus alcaliphilus]|uniref:AraC family transcriptional regulator n=1 Tax=Gracilibacillus alcaliphilus TaxID=1401441 RepID=UPI00195D2D61|nr:AraC family transcriptional regulator [Gracilibacillus alcaliphilus]MBM7678207.1 AraC-like DNA-binding protein [Gracilibacillus alcaliphilus]